MVLHAFWIILNYSACILGHSSYILDFHAFWNILKHSACLLEHFGTFCYSIKCCKKVEFQLDDRHTDIRTCWAASLQLKICKMSLSTWFVNSDICSSLSTSSWFFASSCFPHVSLRTWWKIGKLMWLWLIWPMFHVPVLNLFSFDFVLS